MPYLLVQQGVTVEYVMSHRLRAALEHRALTPSEVREDKAYEDSLPHQVLVETDPGFFIVRVMTKKQEHLYRQSLERKQKLEDYFLLKWIYADYTRRWFWNNTAMQLLKGILEQFHLMDPRQENNHRA